jgi:hypothetical protein
MRRFFCPQEELENGNNPLLKCFFSSRREGIAFQEGIYICIGKGSWITCLFHSKHLPLRGLILFLLLLLKKKQKNKKNIINNIKKYYYVDQKTFTLLGHCVFCPSIYRF